jgi:hypothetical protein
MIRCRIHHLEQRCGERGTTLAAVEACIVARHQDGTIDVDTEHEAYPKPKGPSLARKAVNFSGAVVKHVANGGRQCTDEEIAARYAKCEACAKWRRGDHCTHPSCGCPVSPKRKLVSKLCWASESCPIGEWGAIP